MGPLSAAFAIPHDSADKVVANIAKYGWSIQSGSFFELASAIPLGIVVAIAGELASLTLLNFKVGYFIPVGHFIWMIGVSLTLSASLTNSTGEANEHRA